MSLFLIWASITVLLIKGTIQIQVEKQWITLWLEMEMSEADSIRSAQYLF